MALFMIKNKYKSFDIVLSQYGGVIVKLIWFQSLFVIIMVYFSDWIIFLKNEFVWFVFNGMINRYDYFNFWVQAFGDEDMSWI